MLARMEGQGEVVELAEEKGLGLVVRVAMEELRRHLFLVRAVEAHQRWVQMFRAQIMEEMVAQAPHRL